MVLRFEKSCVFSLLAFFAFSVVTAVVVVQDGGGYQNIVVTFSPDLPKDDQSRALSATKDLMKQASSSVYKATGIHFEEVVLLLPYTWGKLENWSSVENIAYASTKVTYHGADIFVENAEDSVYGNQPYTLQTGGCGRKGVRMNIPKAFLNSDESMEGERAKLIAREWIRYRYGVFYENGYPDDELYPLYFRRPGSDDIHVTGCTDKPVNYTFKNSLGNECPISVDESLRPDSKSAACRPYPQESGNDSEVLSSLMYLQDLPSVVYLCDDQDHIHDADVPNKQNSLCNGRSMWNVMKDHPDFKNRKKSGATDPPPEANFKIVVDRNPRIVFAIDGYTYVPEEIKSIMTKAAEKFVFDLPDETEFALFVFGSTVEEPFEIPFGLLENRSPANLAFVEEGSPCPSCAITKALQVLKDNNPEPEGTIVILSSTDSVDKGSGLLDKLRASQICLVVVLYGTNSSATGFQELLNAVPCSHLWIMPSLEEEAALDILTKLNEELEHVIQNHSYYNAMHTLATKVMSNKDLVSFQTDRSVKDFEIRVTNINGDLRTAFLDSTIEIKNSEGDVGFRRREAQNLRIYQVFSDKGDRWSFEIKKVDPNRLPLLLQVASKESNSRSLRVRSWIEDTTAQEESVNSQQSPVIFYVEVSMGINPVLDAKVHAVVLTPTQTKPEMDLLDNGLGDPDVTKYDGIYSRYFTEFTTRGDYKVIITISDNGGRSRTARPPQSGPSVPCCGSFIPSDYKEDTGPFQRVINANFQARNGRPPNGYKPSKVQDLRFLSLDDQRGLTFQWTSPGNEMDTGTAKEYVFKLFETKVATQSFENEIIGAFTTAETVVPEDYGTKQVVKIQLNETLKDEKNYFFAMRSVSQKGRQSDTSNAVEIFISARVTSPPPTSEANKTGDGEDKKTTTAGSDGKIVGIIVGVCILVIILCVCAYIVFYIFVVRPKRKRDEEKSSEQPPRKEREDRNEEKENEQENDLQMKNTNISPVNSWPSNVLVNHHEKVKDAKRKNEKPPVFTLDDLETSSDEITTISNGMLPNPIYRSRTEDLNDSLDQDHEIYTTPQILQDHGVRPNRRVTHV